jgi:hypothetical protein
MYLRRTWSGLKVEAGRNGVEPLTSEQPTSSAANSALNGCEAARPASAYDLTKFDLSAFSAKWKHKTRLTDEGVEAICHAILKGMPVKQIAKLFRVNNQAPYAYIKRIAGDLEWPHNEIPSWS